MKYRQTLYALLSLMLIVLTTQGFAQIKTSDTVIINEIKAKMIRDPSISIFKVNVHSIKGFVNLSGHVDSDTDAITLIELAQSVEGVRDVDVSQLEIKNSPHPLSDMIITAKIKGLLMREKLRGKNIVAINVHIETNNGTVYLSGNVNSEQEVNNIIKYAKSVHGVKNVKTRLQVGGDKKIH